MREAKSSIVDKLLSEQACRKWAAENAAAYGLNAEDVDLVTIAAVKILERWAAGEFEPVYYGEDNGCWMGTTVHRALPVQAGKSVHFVDASHAVRGELNESESKGTV